MLVASELCCAAASAAAWQWMLQIHRASRMLIRAVPCRLDTIGHRREAQERLRTFPSSAVMITWKAVLQADICAAVLAAVRADACQLLLAPWNRAFELSMHFGIVAWITALHMHDVLIAFFAPLEHHTLSRRA